MAGLYILKRHPIAMASYFRHCLVVTYALPAEALAPLLPPGLVLDSFNGYGFVAVALVQVEKMRPAAAPQAIGQSCSLAGYRIFTRFTTPQNVRWRGLRILRSETNSRLIQLGGNMLTHYNYHFARTKFASADVMLQVTSKASDGLQLQINARIDRPAQSLPAGSVFSDFTQARRFAGPLPYTFDYERETHSIIAIRGDRPQWNPMPVEVNVHRCDFLAGPQFINHQPILSNAFYVKDIPYRWQQGIRFPLPSEQG